MGSKRGKAEVRGQINIGCLLGGKEIGLPTPSWEIPGEFVGSLHDVGFEEEMDLSGVEWYRLHPPKKLFSPG